MLKLMRREGQVISTTGDEQRCKQLLAATVEDLKECIEGLMEAIAYEGETIKFREHDDELRGVGGMLDPRFGMDTLGPRLYEEVRWRRVLRRRWRPVWSWAYDPWHRGLLRGLVRHLRFLSRWTQIRATPGVEIELYLPTGLRIVDRSPAYWIGELTVSADGAVQFSSSGGFCLPADEDNLRLWIAQCNAEVSDEVQAALRTRKDHKEISELEAKAARKVTELATEVAEEQAMLAKTVAEEQAKIYQWLAEAPTRDRLFDKR
jgi:hypothetical protein